MGRYNGILLLSDFDGTLYCDGNGGKISQKNCEAIRYFQSEGGLFSVSSGRWPSWLPKWKDYFVPNTWCILMNGAMICAPDGSEFAYEQPMDEYVYEFDETVRRACPRLEIRRHHNRFDLYMYKGIEEPVDRAKLTPPIFKIVYHIPTELSDEYTEKIRELAGDRYYVSRSWANGIEVQMGGTSKGDAVERVRKLLGDKVTTIVAAGDYENDITMIKAADIGYAVANALPQVKAAADRITVDCHDHAIAKIISEL